MDKADKKMDLRDFVEKCRSCNPVENPGQASALLQYAAAMAEWIADGKDKKEKQDRTPYSKVVELYNNICLDFPKVQTSRQLGSARKRHIKACFSNGLTIEEFEKAFHCMQDNHYFQGKNKQNWHATFDWIIQYNFIVKVLDGNYNQQAVPQKQEQEHSYNLDTIMQYAINNTPKVK